MNIACQHMIMVGNRKKRLVNNAYFNGLRVVDQAVGNVADVFASPQSLQQWVYEFQRAYEMLACSYNQAKLMLDDDQLLQALKTSFYKFNDLYGCVNSYYHSGLPILRDLESLSPWCGSASGSKKIFLTAVS